jgi:hypothetical protein
VFLWLLSSSKVSVARFFETVLDSLDVGPTDRLTQRALVVARKLLLGKMLLDGVVMETRLPPDGQRWFHGEVARLELCSEQALLDAAAEKVVVLERLCGRLAIRFRGRDPVYREVLEPQLRALKPGAVKIKRRSSNCNPPAANPWRHQLSRNGQPL